MNPLTGPVLSGWGEILKNLPPDRYVATFVVLVIFASVFFSRRDRLAVRVPIFILLCVIAVLVIIGPDYIRAKNLPATNPQVEYLASVRYAGVRRTTTSSTFAFGAASGQVNFGCGQTVPVIVRWALPPGSTLLDRQATWANVDNAKNPTMPQVSV